MPPVEAFRPVRTRALREAIKSAPGDITEKREITNISNQTIQIMCEVRLPDGFRKDIFPHGFKEMYDATTGVLKGKKEKEAFNRYLISTSTIFASSMMLFDFQPEKGENREQTLERLKKQTMLFSSYQFLSAHYLLQSLTKEGSKEYTKIQEEMAKTTRGEIKEDTLRGVTESIEKTFIGRSATGRALKMLTTEVIGSAEKRRNAFIKKTSDEAREEFKKGTSKKPPIRFVMGIFDAVAEYCRKKRVENPLLNLTLGDVTGLGMPEEVAEALALNPIGPKGLMLAARARMYIQLAYMSGKSGDKQRYEGDSLGWPALREKFIQYGQEFGLYKKENLAIGSIIGSGGADALYRALRTVDVHLRKTIPLEEGQKLKAYFANPAFRMVSAKVRDAGFDLFEEQTTLEDNYRPDLKKVDAYFKNHQDCKVFVYVPINNPSSDITTKEYMDKLLGILKTHGAVLINDMAYLGTGDLEKNKELAQSINTYEDRVDVYSMSKIFGRTGLRCGCAISTIKGLSEKDDVVPIAQGIQLGNAYPMQAEALATWELVGKRDRKLLNEHYKRQQKNFINRLKRIDGERENSLFAWDKPFFFDAALYAWVPLTEGNDAFGIIPEAFLVGTPDTAFFQSKIIKGIRYIRFALGVEEIPEEETTT